jgi:hypothetical protein
MAVSGPVQKEFFRRLAQIPAHGLGLSVDVYSPDLTSLRRALQEGQVLPGYLEVFRATQTALASVRKQAGSGFLTYHGEGLWLTQPEAADDPLFKQEVCEVAGHLQTLQSAWLNHECATKYMAGYAFGTYLPPLYTPSRAQVVADNTLLVQDLLDRLCALPNGGAPLVLLEMPPLTYFVAGTLTIPNFFGVVTEKVPCGLVLDIGHLWTVFRYTGAWRTTPLAQFTDAFLAEFPVDRIVEIHVAGLAVHESGSGIPGEPADAAQTDCLPAWADAHAAPIPPVLFDMLDQVLSHPRLSSLKGLALEVDTKEIGLIVDEFTRFSQRYAAAVPSANIESGISAEGGHRWFDHEPGSSPARQALSEAYDHYARVVAGRAEPEGPEWNPRTACIEDLDRYRRVYLPYEILRWGGDVEAMFPDSCRRLRERHVPLSRFVSFWFRQPRPLSGSYDFFLLKIERFAEFVREAALELSGIAEREAGELRQAYHAANEPAVETAGELP